MVGVAVSQPERLVPETNSTNLVFNSFTHGVKALILPQLEHPAVDVPYKKIQPVDELFAPIAHEVYALLNKNVSQMRQYVAQISFGEKNAEPERIQELLRTYLRRNYGVHLTELGKEEPVRGYDFKLVTPRNP